jgi:hypothetical protein
MVIAGGCVGLQAEGVDGGDVAPRITYSTAIEQQTDHASGAAVDAEGNLWLVGGTASDDFPVTSDAADPVRSAFDDVYVVRLDAAGQLAYATFLGGSGINCVGGIAVDEEGSVYIAGTTTSTDMQVTEGAAQATAAGGFGDGFIAKLDSAGRLVAATYFGGSSTEACNGRGFPAAAIALAPGAVYALIGATNSTQFPASGALRGRVDSDGLLVRLDRNLQPAWGRFIGGSFLDEMNAVASDAEGNAYVAGYVSRTLGMAHDFATTPGAFQPTTESDGPPVLVKYTPAGDLAYATFLTATNGESGSRWRPNLAVAPDGTAYVAVVTNSAAMPATPGAFRTTPAGFSDLFLFAVQPDGRALRYGTYVGGGSDDQANLTFPALALDAAGQVALGFATFSTDLPLRNAFLTEPTSNAIVKLSADGADLVYASYVRHAVTALAHRDGALYVGGRSFPPDNGLGALRLREAPAPACAGDCDGDATVLVNELVVGVRIALGELAADACAAIDGDGDGDVSIAELIGAVGALLNGC